MNTHTSSQQRYTGRVTDREFHSCYTAGTGNKRHGFLDESRRRLSVLAANKLVRCALVVVHRPVCWTFGRMYMSEFERVERIYVVGLADCSTSLINLAALTHTPPPDTYVFKSARETVGSRPSPVARVKRPSSVPSCLLNCQEMNVKV